MSVALHVLNPGKKPRGKSKGKKKGARKAAPKKKTMAKRKAKKRKSPVARAVHAVKRRVRKAVSNPRKGLRRRRRRNPSAKAMLGGLKRGLPTGKELIGIGIGVLAVSAATKALSDGTPLFAGSGPSSLAGESWNIKQYAAAAAIALVGGQLADKVIKGSGHAVSLAAVVFAIAKTVMPLAAKTPLSRFLGEAEGDVRVDDDGQSWIMQGGRWNALQGLVQATPMDALDEANALDGLVQATPMDGHYEDEWGITTSNLSVNAA
jgi:hypothetical protein